MKILILRDSFLGGGSYGVQNTWCSHKIIGHLAHFCFDWLAVGTFQGSDESFPDFPRFFSRIQSLKKVWVLEKEVTPSHWTGSTIAERPVNRALLITTQMYICWIKTFLWIIIYRKILAMGKEVAGKYSAILNDVQNLHFNPLSANYRKSNVSARI